MAGAVINELARNKEAFEKFKINPLETVKILEKNEGSDFGKLSVSDIEVIRNLSFDELELLSSIYNKTKDNSKPFKLG